MASRKRRRLSDKGAAALSYAEAGFAVVPCCWPVDGSCGCGRGCPKPGKAPLTPHGHKDGTTDRDQVIEWWTSWPHANVGLVINEERGEVVLDIDPRNGGVTSLKRLLGEHGRLPRTPAADTGGGGRHYLFVASGPVANRTGAKGIAPGVEVKTKGLVIVYPSTHASGGEYEWRRDPRSTPWGELPDWLADMANDRAGRTPGGGYDEPRVLKEGGRNDGLARHAGSLLARGTPPSALGDALIGFNLRSCDPPLSEREVRAIAASIEGADRRSHPERYDKDPDPVDPWLTVDFTATPEPPDWVVDGLIERGTVTLLAADTGVGKSMLSTTLVASMLRDQSFLDRKTVPGRVMVLDCENPERVAIARLRGLLLGEPVPEPERHERLTAVNAIAADRLRIRVGGGTIGTDWLERQIIEFQPDLIVIDTVLAALGLEEVSDNTEAARRMGGLRQIAAAHRVAIVLLHHESKPSKDRPGGRGFEAMGARSWVGQADTMIRLTRDTAEVHTDAFGHRCVRTTIKMTVPKMRDGVPPAALGIEFRSEYNAAGALEWLTAAAIDVGLDERPPTQLVQIVELLGNRGPLRQGELATALGINRNSGTLRRTLLAALQTGTLAREDGRSGRFFIPPSQEAAA